MRRFFLIGIFLVFCFLAGAQGLMHVENKAFNIGVKVGLSSTLPIVNSLSINGEEVGDIDVEYRVGYMATAFFRLNIKRFFFQPGLSWHHSEENIWYTTSESETDALASGNTAHADNLLRMKTHALELPLMVGYNLVKEDIYGLSLVVGPKVKYNYKKSYTVESALSEVEFVSDNTPVCVTIALGLGVSIGRLFLDFAYDFGLNQVESEFIQANDSDSETGTAINIDKRTNEMSFSLGLLF